MRKEKMWSALSHALEPFLYVAESIPLKAYQLFGYHEWKFQANWQLLVEAACGGGAGVSFLRPGPGTALRSSRGSCRPGSRFSSGFVRRSHRSKRLLEAAGDPADLGAGLALGLLGGLTGASAGDLYAVCQCS